VAGAPPEITIPHDLLPADGRFNSGPSKVRPEAVEDLAAVGRSLLGTSHRQAPVRSLVGDVRRGLTELLGLPDGWEVVLGNGGTTVFWDAATFGLVESRSQHAVFGEFSGKFAEAVAAAPHLGEPELVEAAPGTCAEPKASDVDAYALTHNETSTGVVAPLRRPEGTSADSSLVLVDATSGAGAIPFDPAEADVYYFAPQKVLAADGGLWLAACSPAAVARIERLAGGDRWCPASIDLGIALDSTLRWLLANGGLSWAAERCGRSAATLYGWAEARDWATPFVTDPALRSPTVGTVDLDGAVPAATVSKVLRRHGVVDIDAYRKLGRNQLRVGMYPAVEPDDVAALTACIDYVVERLEP
jgi:phosphoserine aminotransferase